jgi:S1-C subfamily serine protease
MMQTPWRAVGLLVLLLALTGPKEVLAGDDLPHTAYTRLGAALSGRTIAEERDWTVGPRTRGQTSLREVVRRVVTSVPLVISNTGTGSGVVTEVGQAGGIVVTNHHVVKDPIKSPDGQEYVVLLFFDRQLSAERFDVERLERCVATKFTGEWCQAVKRSARSGVTLAADHNRDLALVFVPDLPTGVGALPPARVEEVQAGDDVSVIGHPLGFLWTVTTGIVSAIRPRYPMGDGLGTIIQTQTPISPGSSGGPLLTPNGELLGVIVWGVVQEAQGLNAAIAINEIQAFATELERKLRQR